jgi:hypothetical protein
MKPDCVLHKDGTKSDRELFEPMLGDDTFPEDVDYAKQAEEKPDDE